MPLPLRPLEDRDGSWTALKADWRAQCHQYGEDFETYALEMFSALDPLAAQGHPRAGIFALTKGQSHDAVCQVNRTPLPGYDGQVLRVRHLTFSPKYDFGDFPIEEYGALLGQVFTGILQISQDVMEAPHIKFHLRSPAERQFFASLQEPLMEIGRFQRVEVHGTWLYVTKT